MGSKTGDVAEGVKGPEGSIVGDASLLSWGEPWTKPLTSVFIRDERGFTGIADEEFGQGPRLELGSKSCDGRSRI